MKKKFIKRLAEESYSKKKLDRKKVFAFAKALKRGDLREYLRNLKNYENRLTVTVTLPSALEVGEIKRRLSKIYPDKRIVFTIDPSMIAGIRVVDYDNVYELSLKNFLETTLNQITYQND